MAPATIVPDTMAVDTAALDKKSVLSIPIETNKVSKPNPEDSPTLGVQNISSLPKYHGFKEAIVRFEDRSLWKITEPLSSKEFQQSNPPFEVRQVFNCVRLDDPQGNHPGIEEAAMKVKYQYVHSIPSYSD
jgi:hypothetical protein